MCIIDRVGAEQDRNGPLEAGPHDEQSFSPTEVDGEEQQPDQDRPHDDRGEDADRQPDRPYPGGGERRDGHRHTEQAEGRHLGHARQGGVEADDFGLVWRPGVADDDARDEDGEDCLLYTSSVSSGSP